MDSSLATVELEEDICRPVRPDTLMGFVLGVDSVGGFHTADDGARGGENLFYYAIALDAYKCVSYQ